MASPTPDSIVTAQSEVRRYCGWHVTPAETVTITVDGPGGPVLILPTLHLVTLTAVTEDGVVVNVADLFVSDTGRVRKRDGAWWTSNYGAVTVTLTHGFDEVPEFDKAVTALAGSLTSPVRADGNLSELQVDDVRYKWADSGLAAMTCENYGLSLYRLERQP